MSSDIEVIEEGPRDFVGIRETIEISEISSKMGQFFHELFEFFGRNRVQPDGPPFAFYHSYNMEMTDVECGVPVKSPTEGDGRVKMGRLPQVRAIRATHIGPYDTLMETYMMIEAWAKERDYELDTMMWEYYITDPNVEKDPSRWVTEIHWPLR